MEIRVYYEDTDCGGVVYYANYLKYFERARTEFLRSAHINLLQLANEGISFVVSKAEIEYKHPARYGEILWIDTEIVEVNKASFIIEYKIFKKGAYFNPTQKPEIKQKKELSTSLHQKLTKKPTFNSKLLIQGMTKMVSVNNNGKPTKLHEDILKKLLNLKNLL